MARSTQELRDLWTPACAAKGDVLFPAYDALDTILERHRYRPRSGVTGAYNCRKITGGTGWSLHAYGPGERYTLWTGVPVAMAVAVDINWDKNPYGPRLVTDMPREMVTEILAIKTIDGLPVWRWGGYYANNKDAMHYEVVVSPTELARGIAGVGTDEEAELGAALDAIMVQFDQQNRAIDHMKGSLAAIITALGTSAQKFDVLTALVQDLDDGGQFDAVQDSELAAAFEAAAAKLRQPGGG